MWKMSRIHTKHTKHTNAIYLVEGIHIHTNLKLVCIIPYTI